MDFSLVEVGTMVRTSRSGGVVWDDPYPFLGGRYEIWREATISAMLPPPWIKDKSFPRPWWGRVREALQKLDEGLSILRGFGGERVEVAEIARRIEELCDQLEGLIR